MQTRGAERKRRSSARHFDRWARKYESDRVSRWLAELQQAALVRLGLTAQDRLLDVGCGTGAAVRLACATVARGVGVDSSPAMIARARELAGGLANAEFVEADAEGLPFTDASFTAVLCTTSLHHYPSPAAAIAQMARVLAPSGRVVIADAVTDVLAVRSFDRVLRVVQASHVGCLSTAEIEGLLAGAGLAQVSATPLLGGAFATVFARRAGAGS